MSHWVWQEPFPTTGNTAAGFGDAASNSHVSIPDDTRLYGHRAQTVTGWFQVDDLDATWQAVYFKGDSGDDATTTVRVSPERIVKTPSG